MLQGTATATRIVRSENRPGLLSPQYLPSWGFVPCWYRSAPFALVSALLLLTGCQSAPAPRTSPQPAATTQSFPPRPAVPAPAFKVFHQDNDTYTLITAPNATDGQVAAILYELRDAAEHHSFDSLHLSQAFIDARKPIVWFHVYRGAKCASEKFTKGAYPCGASYHGAGDFTLGDYKNPNWNDAVLFRADGAEVHLWDPDAARCQEPKC
jgi:hypothetical protein